MTANTLIGIGALGGGLALMGTPAGAVLGVTGTITGVVGALHLPIKNLLTLKPGGDGYVERVEVYSLFY